MRRRHPGGIPAYLLDSIATAPAAAFGFRLLRAAYAGSPIVKLRRDSDNAENDFTNVSGGEDLNVTAISTWLSGATPYIVTLYDQENGNDATQATAAKQPLFVASGQNGKPVGRFDGVNDYFVYTANITGASTMIAACVWTGTKAVNFYPQVIGKGEPSSTLYNAIWASLNNSDNWGTYINSSKLSSYSLATWRIAVSISDGNTGNPSVNSLITNGNIESVSDTARYGGDGSSYTRIGAVSNGVTGQFKGDIAELIVYASALSTADRQTLESNINAYWSIYA